MASDNWISSKFSTVSVDVCSPSENMAITYIKYYVLFNGRVIFKQYFPKKQ